MKKTLILTLVFTLFLSACSSKWNELPNPGITDEQIVYYENIIEEGEAKLKDSDSISTSTDVAFAYEQLGELKKAIKYYEQA